MARRATTGQARSRAGSVRYWGWYSNAARGRRARHQGEASATPRASTDPADGESRQRRSHRSDRWTPGYALAVRYPREALLRYGVELRQDFGEERQSLLVPQLWFSLPHDATFKIGGGWDLDGQEREHFWRMVFEIEF